MIEKNIFMIWLGNAIPKYAKYSSELFKKVNPNYKFHFIHYTIGEIEKIGDMKEFTVIKYDKVDRILFNCFEQIRTNDNERFTSAKLPFIQQLGNKFRWNVINEFGGIYLDCDCYPTKPFDDHLLNIGNFTIATKNISGNVSEDGFFLGFKSKSYFTIEKTILPPIVNGDKLPNDIREQFFNCKLELGYSYNQDSYIEHFCDRRWFLDKCRVEECKFDSIMKCNTDIKRI